MIFDTTILSQWGPLGVFVAYLIYDRQILLTKNTSVLEKLSMNVESLKETVQENTAATNNFTAFVQRRRT